MADENPIGDQTKKQSPTKQTATPPKPKEAAPAGTTPKQPQSDVAPKSSASSTAPKTRSTKQAKPAAVPASRDDAKITPRPAAAAPRPASLAKPGSGPADSRPGSAPGREAQRGPGQPANSPQGDRRPAQQGSVNEGDSTYSQRVFDPTASDTVPGRGGRVVGPGGASGGGASRGGWDNNRGSSGSGGSAPRSQSGPRPAGSQPSGQQNRPTGGSSSGGSSSGGGYPTRSSSGPSRSGGNNQSHGKQSHTGSRGRPADGAVAGSPRPGTAPMSARAAAAAPSAVTEIIIPASLTVRELADKMHRSPIDIIKTLMNYGIMVPITQSIDFNTAAVVGEELGISVKSEEAPEPETVEATDDAPKQTLRQKIMADEKEENLVVRPPVVTVLGHVDHGKTTLLDAIRETRVVDGEAGGITQHIGAYQVERNGKKITFLDTPGHEAFTAMRARGAQVTDFAIVVVAADDGVMPQTKEAIAHVKAAQVPIIIALNKIDKPNANPERVKQELADNGVLIEEYGGDTMCVPVSAKMRRGIDDLLEHILLLIEIEPLRSNPVGDCKGTVIESRLDKTRGATATLLVQNGTLRIGDSVVTGETSAKIRAMYDDKGEPITEAGPSTPVMILGLVEVPTAGDTFEVVADDRTARNIASERVERRRAASAAPATQARTLESFFAAAEAGQTKELNLILKADVQGSIEPIANSLDKLGDDKVKVKILHQAAGNITEGDVMLASASKAIILGFSVAFDGTSQRIAEAEGVEVRLYNIIYNIIEDVQKALTGLLEPVYKEVVTGHAEIRQVFKVTKVGKVAGCMVIDGELTRNTMARIKRGDQILREDKIVSLKRFQEDAPEVKTGFECGLNFGNFNDFEVGDIIEAYKKERVS
jgi:translation initiation factor IF-2